jgi:glycosyltransferase involved in cell wall biosynthesis
MPRVLGLTPSGFDPAGRFRVKQFIPYLEQAGWEVCFRPNRPDRLWSSRLSNRFARAAHHRLARIQMKWNRLRDIQEAGRSDVVFANRDLAGKGEFFQRQLLRRNPRVIFDFDDAIYLGRSEAAIRRMCERAAWVTPGNEFLAEFARHVTERVTVFPTVVDTDCYQPRPRRPGRVRVGWSGSDQSIAYGLMPYLGMLAEIRRDVDFELVVITNSRPRIIEPGLPWSFLPWTEATEVEGLQTLDVGLMPLQDNEFERGKCGLKLLQYMALGIPAVASPVGVNQEIVRHGETGYLAATEAQWGAAIGALARDRDLRLRIGDAARQRCEQHYSIRRWLPVLLDLFERVAHCQTAPGSVERGWEPSR